MWFRFVVVLAAIAAVRSDDSGVTGARRFIEPRIGAAAMRLGRIERNLERLRDRIKEAAKIDGEGFINDINDRLDHVEDKKDHCDSDKEIRCGRDTLECVNTLLLCDGRDDCHNGYDESDKVCSAGPAVVGNVFQGTAHWTGCRPREDHPVKVTITQTYKSKFFGSRLIVKGIISADFTEGGGEHHEYKGKGYYVYGKKRLVLFPENAADSIEHNGVVCDFVHGNDKTAECTLANEASLTPCARFHVSEQE